VPESQLDAIVVGAGPNGLAAAIALAQAGRSVRVIEGEPAIGGGTRTEELTLPGHLHDVCSAVHPLLIGSPFLASLPLAEHGLAVIHPDLPLAHPLDGGRAVALHRSVAETAAGLGADGAAYERLLGRSSATGRSSPACCSARRSARPGIRSPPPGSPPTACAPCRALPAAGSPASRPARSSPGTPPTRCGR